MTGLIRRRHRKSRHGCAECKRRRVKVRTNHRKQRIFCSFISQQCDEARPACSNCTKRHSKCSYETLTSLLWTNEESSAGSSYASESDSGQPGEHVSRVTCTPDSSPIPGDLSGINTAAAWPSSVLNLQDLELIMQWCNSTRHALSRKEHTDTIWCNIVPKEALSYPFSMHSILTLSALHLSRTWPRQSRRAL